jgi:hypothetical protein
MNVAEAVSIQAIRLCRYFMDRNLVCPDGLPIPYVSPFLFDLFYRSIVRQQEIYYETGNKASLEASNMVKGIMGLFAKRWQVAGSSSLKIWRVHNR